jgi:hypothetical protein
MPGYERNVLEFQRRDARRETAAGSAVQNGNVLEIQRRNARRKTAAGNAGQNKKFLKLTDATPSAFNAAGNANKTKVLKIHRRDAVSFCFADYGYFKALHVKVTKSHFSLSV